MAPTYKLSYFDLRGYAEPIRFLLSYGGIDFENIIVDRANWPDLQPSMPFGQLPVIEVDGKLSDQSIAISRYIAKQVKLVGLNDWEDLEIDAIVDTLADLSYKLLQYWLVNDEVAKELHKVKLFKETVPQYLGKLESIAEESNGHLALKKLTWADLYFASRVESFNSMADKDLLADYPHLRALQQNILSLPGIKSWVANRRETKF